MNEYFLVDDRYTEYQCPNCENKFNLVDFIGSFENLICPYCKFESSHIKKRSEMNGE